MSIYSMYIELELERIKTQRKGRPVLVSYEKINEDQIMFAGDYLAKWFDASKLWDKDQYRVMCGTLLRSFI